MVFKVVRRHELWGRGKGWEELTWYLEGCWGKSHLLLALACERLSLSVAETLSRAHSRWEVKKGVGYQKKAGNSDRGLAGSTLFP